MERSSGAVRTACDLYRLMAGEGRETQAKMEETDGERLPCVEAHNSWPSRKEYLV